MAFFSEPHLSEAYRMAYQYYQTRQYREALPLFRVLVVGNHEERKYWKGMAACLQMIQEWKEALLCYQTAIFLDPDSDLELYIHAADCCFSMDQVNEGLDLLNKVKEKAEKAGNKHILTHVDLMESVWNNHLKVR